MFESLFNELNDGNNDSLELLGILGGAAFLSGQSRTNQLKLKALQENAENHASTKAELKAIKDQLIQLLGPQLEELRRNKSLPKCPWCGGPIERGFVKCRHCGERLIWIGNVPYTEQQGLLQFKQNIVDAVLAFKISEERAKIQAQRNLEAKQKAETAKRLAKESKAKIEGEVARAEAARREEEAKQKQETAQREKEQLNAGLSRFPDFEQRLSTFKNVIKHNQANPSDVRCCRCIGKSSFPHFSSVQFLPPSLFVEIQMQYFANYPTKLQELYFSDFADQLKQFCFENDPGTVFCKKCVEPSLLAKCSSCGCSTHRSMIQSGLCWNCIFWLAKYSPVFRQAKCPSCDKRDYLRNLLFEDNTNEDTKMRMFVGCKSCFLSQRSPKGRTLFGGTKRSRDFEENFAKSIQQMLPLAPKYYFLNKEQSCIPVSAIQLLLSESAWRNRTTSQDQFGTDDVISASRRFAARSRLSLTPNGPYDLISMNEMLRLDDMRSKLRDFGVPFVASKLKMPERQLDDWITHPRNYSETIRHIQETFGAFKTKPNLV